MTSAGDGAAQKAQYASMSGIGMYTESGLIENVGLPWGQNFGWCLKLQFKISMRYAKKLDPSLLPTLNKYGGGLG